MRMDDRERPPVDGGAWFFTSIWLSSADLDHGSVGKQEYR
ncbi:hypothetical protein FrEUN1fDRAFT_4319 [Parafrankia sp. EUN1f]|nr:hypothetical protein FrEUN1fDRAFT_4319 [Parafrankia sp. EUN1f]